jgi:4-amino-4-deoxy-L-arabinose transferase-like glycosyltransferase
VRQFQWQDDLAKMAFSAFDTKDEATAAQWAMRLAFVLLGLTLFRVVALSFNATDLFFDEAQYWSWSLNPAFGYYSKPPMIAWLIGLSGSICGSSEFCVRLPSPLLHFVTGFLVFAIGWRLYDARTGFWSGVVFATLPGVSLSAGIISTDVPLLLFWAAALLMLTFLLEEKPAWWVAPALGVAIGLGLNAKYAMAYFVLCALIFFQLTPKYRHMLRDMRWWGAVAIGLAIISPNLLWNYENSFATFAHTADNANWSGAMFRPHKAIEFLGAQFGVFGPILLAGLLIIALRWYKGELPENDRLLFAFAAPIIVIVTLQAFLSRAHANWAAVSYVAATVLVTATMIRDISWGWLRASLLVHVGILVALAIMVANAGSFRLPNGEDPFSRTLGWENLANETRKQIEKARAEGKPFGSVLTLDRSVTAELLYYLRDDRTPIRAWSPTGRPRDHYQLTLAYKGKLPDPVLLVAIGGIPFVVADRFAEVDYIAVENIAAGAAAPRRVTFARLAGMKR